MDLSNFSSIFLFIVMIGYERLWTTRSLCSFFLLSVVCLSLFLSLVPSFCFFLSFSLHVCLSYGQREIDLFLDHSIPSLCHCTSYYTLRVHFFQMSQKTYYVSLKLQGEYCNCGKMQFYYRNVYYTIGYPLAVSQRVCIYALRA